MKLTRRQLAATLAAAAPAVAQQSVPPQPENLDETARARMKANVSAMNAVNLPMSTEPAVTFKVV